MKFSILGASGFVGRELSLELTNSGHTVYTPDRSEIENILEQKNLDLGKVFYCVGMTANFREQPVATIEAHVNLLNKILCSCDFDNLTYLSSTRVYYKAVCTDENADLSVNSNDPSDFYNISKLMGESLCLSSKRNTRVVRLSNVYGENSSASFLKDVFSDIKSEGSVVFKSSPESEKDYISVKDAIHMLPKIACHGKHRTYNLASGKNTSNLEIADALSKSGYTFSFEDGAPTWKFKSINIDRIKNEFGFIPSNLLDDMGELI